MEEPRYNQSNRYVELTGHGCLLAAVLGLALIKIYLHGAHQSA